MKDSGWVSCVSGVVFDRITRDDIRVVDKTVALRMEE
jgi:hypothetical protein